MSNEFRIPKRPITVELWLSGRDPWKVSLYLSEQAANHLGSERPTDILQGENDFIPCVDGEHGIRFVQRASLLAMTVPAEEELGGDMLPAEDLAGELAKTSEVHLQMDDGSEFKGFLTYVLPEARSRLLDFLNEHDRYIALRDGNLAHLVNKKRIAWIRPA